MRKMQIICICEWKMTTCDDYRKEMFLMSSSDMFDV